jgi:hypothetical protein
MGLITMVSCTKTGPAGAAGATGATGATGAAGPDSVQYSPWITLVTQGRSVDMFNDSIYIDTITAPAVTSSVLSSGAVIGYLYTLNPLTGDSAILNVDDEQLVALVQVPEAGKIVLYWFPYADVDYTGYKYRYVIIPGNIETTSTSGTSPLSYNPGQLKTMTYPDLDGILKMRTSGNLMSFRQ